MQTADVIAFPTPDIVDLEDVHLTAATMDFLAELVDGVAAEGFIVVDAGLAEELRALADVLLQLADNEVQDAVALRTQVARADDLTRRAAEPLHHAGARRMLGGPLYERVRPAVMALGELSTLAYERSLDANPAALAEEMPIRRFGRVAARGYDWAQWNADAPLQLHTVLIDALRRATQRAAEQRAAERHIPGGDEVLGPIDAAPLADALETVLDEWIACMPAPVIADYAAERDPDPLFGDCFDVGVACSIARRLLAATGAAPADTADVEAWLIAACETVSGEQQRVTPGG